MLTEPGSGLMVSVEVLVGENLEVTVMLGEPLDVLVGVGVPVCSESMLSVRLEHAVSIRTGKITIIQRVDLIDRFLYHMFWFSATSQYISNGHLVALLAYEKQKGKSRPLSFFQSHQGASRFF
jgi:hypothetical protein